jgi:hypothetical protein
VRARAPRRKSCRVIRRHSLHTGPVSPRRAALVNSPKDQLVHRSEPPRKIGVFAVARMHHPRKEKGSNSEAYRFWLHESFNSGVWAAVQIVVAVVPISD